MTKNYPVSTDIVVQWGEMDALGHVNNSKYFDYMQAARIEYFIQLGQHELMAGRGNGPVLAQIGCQFMRPIVFPDTVTIGCWIERIGNTSMQMNYEIYSQSQQAVVAKGDSVVVMIDYTTGKKVPLTDTEKERIYKLQPDLKG